MKYTFDELVEARAKERTEVKIQVFRADIHKAMRKLCPSYAPSNWAYAYPPNGIKCLSVVANGENDWPVSLWEHERETVAEELLATMDAMQQAIVAAQKQESKEEANGD